MEDSREAAVEELVPGDFGEPGAPERKVIASKVRQFYFNGGKVEASPYLDYQSHTMCIMGIILAARWISLHPSNVPTYLYVFDIRGKWNRFSNHFSALKEKPEMTDFQEKRMPMHCDDVGYVFGSRPPAPVNISLDNHSLEATTARRMVALFTNFAKTGNPTEPWDPDVGDLQWTSLPNSFRVPYNHLLIGKKLRVLDGYMKEDMDFWFKIYEDYFKFRSPQKVSSKLQ